MATKRLLIVIVRNFIQRSKIGVLQEGFVKLNYTGLNSSGKEVKKLPKYTFYFSTY